MAEKPSRWLPIFEEFVKDIRITSKEVSSQDDRGIPLVLWDSQKRFLKEIAYGLDRGIREFYCLKSRQLGITTVSLAIDIFFLAMHKNSVMALVTENEKNRDKNRATLRQYVNSFPDGYFGDDFRIIKGGDNRQHMKFSNGSRIDFLVAGTKDKGTSWGEGEGYVMAHCTEVSAYGSSDALDSFMESFAQTNPDRLYLFESTAKGFNHWKDLWTAGKEDPFTKHSFFCGWYTSAVNRIERSDPRFAHYGTHPASGEEREKIAAVSAMYGHKILPEQLAWIRWRQDQDEKKGGDGLMLDQNQPWTERDAFTQSGFSFFQTRQITQDMRALDESPPGFVSEGGIGFQGYRYEVDGGFFDMKLVVEEEDIDAVELRVWEQPVKDAKYVLGFDPAWGRNDWKDRNCLSLWRCFAEKLVLVAEYATSDHEVKHASWVAAHLAGAYGDTIVNYEINGPGNVIKMEWDNIRGQLNAEMNERLVRDRDWEDALSNARFYIYQRPDSGGGAGSAIGFSTTFNNKSVLMHNFRGAYVTRELVIRSHKLLGEMHNVVQEGGSIGAPEGRGDGSKDDRVFAAALAIRAWLEWVRPGMIANGETYERVMKEETGKTSKQMARVRDQVFRFFKSQEDLANAEPSRGPRFLVDRGLI